MVLLHLSLLLALLQWPEVMGHGRLVEPPSRSSMWRFGFKTKRNYNDNELFCGGYTVQWQRNGGKCGICGDAWHLPKPRPNEAGGIYGRGIIVKRYTPGQVIKSTVEITANHKGFFEFKICPHNDPKTEATQDCLDRYPLELADGSGTMYFPSRGTGPFSVHLKLPDGVTCSQCVFQWTYTAGNNWGRCENGTSKVGCGPQETFRGCSDIAIGEYDSNSIPTYNNNENFGPSISAMPTRSPPKTKPKVKPTRKRQPTRPWRRPYTNLRPHPTMRLSSTMKRPTYRRTRPTQIRRPSTTTTRRPTTTTRQATKRYQASSYPRRRYNNKATTLPWMRYTSRPINRKQQMTKKPRPTYKNKPNERRNNIETEGGKCKSVGVWKNVPGIASWCDVNCPRGYCPSTHCDCSGRK